MLGLSQQIGKGHKVLHGELFRPLGEDGLHQERLQLFRRPSFTGRFSRGKGPERITHHLPALTNEQAWNTAKNMVNQIGSPWDLSLVPQMAWQHRAVLLLFVLGMIVHWLPERFKRRYRLTFARLPLFWMALAVVAILIFIYQFITADLQSFIYFQF